MHRYLRASLLAVALFASANASVASDSLRVGNRVLVVGDSAATVLGLLGKPAHKSRRGGTRSSGHRGRRARAASGNGSASERWQYRRDGHVIVVTLVDGRVSDIDERSR